MTPFCFNVLNPSIIEFQSSRRFWAWSIKLQRASTKKVSINLLSKNKRFIIHTGSKFGSNFVHIVKVVNHENMITIRGNIRQLLLT
eukprot:m.4296 g.4296  ORF g.4296 m.4296 type:complete len:86 (+) comp10516_c0_seq1:134-391(+)